MSKEIEEFNNETAIKTGMDDDSRMKNCVLSVLTRYWKNYRSTLQTVQTNLVKFHKRLQ